MLVEGHEIFPVNQKPFLFDKLVMHVISAKSIPIISKNQVIPAAFPETNPETSVLYEFKGDNSKPCAHIVGNKCPYLDCFGYLAGYMISARVPSQRDNILNSIILPDICIGPNGDMCKNPGQGCFLHIDDLSLHEHNYPGRIPYFKYYLFEHLEQNIPFDIYRL